MREILTNLFEQKTLNEEEAKNILIRITSGEFSDVEIASFLTVYQMRGITVPELSGFRNALLEICVKTDLSEFDTIDVCGTGGDGKNTFNISTLTTFVLAGAGAKVAKHGNVGVSSASGSSNIMENMGYKFSTDADKLKKELDVAGVCYLHAPIFNPAMKNVAPVRKALRVKTFFNMLGPLANPSRPLKQMVGVFNLEIARLYSYVLQDAGMKYSIIYSLDGYDEISLTSGTKVITNDFNKVFQPADLGLNKYKPEDLFGGNTVEEAVKIFSSILEGKGTKAQNDVLTVNAAFGLNCYFGKPIEECIGIAKETLESGRAMGALKKLIELQ